MVQNRCLDIIGLPRNTVDLLATRRDNLTSKEFKSLKELSEHSCRRFLEVPINHPYELRSNKSMSSRPLLSRTNRHQSSFIVRGDTQSITRIL